MEEITEKSNLFILNSIYSEHNHDNQLTINSNENMIKSFLINTQANNLELKNLVDYQSLNRLINDQNTKEEDEQKVIDQIDRTSKNSNDDQLSLDCNLICSSSNFYDNTNFSNSKVLSNFDKSFVNNEMPGQSVANTTKFLYSSNYKNTDDHQTSSELTETTKTVVTSTIVTSFDIASAHCIEQSADKVDVVNSNIEIKANSEQKQQEIFETEQQTSHKRGHKLNHHNNKKSSSNQKYHLPNQASRESHNEKERKRRSRMKKSCEMLRKIVPGISNKTDKASVLESTVQYLIHLQKCLNYQKMKQK